MIFQNATSVRVADVDAASGTTTFTADINDGWDIRGNANGGYLLALAAQAMKASVGRPDVSTISAHFLSPGTPGPVDIATNTIKEGKRFATVAGAMSRGAKPMLQLVGAFTDHSLSGNSFERVEGEPPDLPSIEECVRVEGGEGFPPEAMNRVRLHMHPEDVFWTGDPSGKLLTRGWFELHDDEPVDTIALLLAADIFPPTVFPGALPVAWVPTVEMTCHVRGRAAPGPLRCQFTSRFVSGGFLEEDGEIWDSSNTMIAQSRQLALLPRAEGAAVGGQQ